MTLSVAQTILSQLGGNKFLAMTGAKNLVGGSDSLQFSIGRGAVNKANKVRITLNDFDEYTVSFYNFRKLELREIETVNGVTVDTLRAVFTNRTGMAVSL